MSKPSAKPRKLPKPDPRRVRVGEELQRHLGHSFQNPRLFEQALTHRSYSAQNNERFEFVGDAILDYSVAKMLFDAFPGYSEGELSRLRANLVNQDVLAEIARSMGVGDALYLGVGELKSGGFDRPSILADAATLAAKGLVELNATGLTVTPKGRFLIRNIAMVFDRHLRSRDTAAKYSQTV